MAAQTMFYETNTMQYLERFSLDFDVCIWQPHPKSSAAWLPICQHPQIWKNHINLVGFKIWIGCDQDVKTWRMKRGCMSQEGNVQGMAGRQQEDVSESANILSNKKFSQKVI